MRTADLICLGPLIKSRAVTNLIFFLLKILFSIMCAQRALSEHLKK